MNGREAVRQSLRPLRPAETAPAVQGAIFFPHLCLAALCSLILIVAACGRKTAEERTEDGRLVIHYWEKWSGFEADAMRAVVDQYNESQDRVFVKFLSTSQIQRKLLLATAGGEPPDVAGFAPNYMHSYISKGALEPLDRFIERDGLSMDDYLPVAAEQCRAHGFVWALPTTPATLALHYNKRLFREAGLDPDRPPRTLAELDAYAKKLTRRNASGDIEVLGFNPVDPGWWTPDWLYWFGGRLWDGEKELLLNSPESIAAYEWAAGYTETYGVDAMQTMKTGLNFNSLQNAFISEKLAMQLQGVWMGNFIEKYNPDLEWGVGPFPAADPKLGNVTIFETDLLVMPKGCPHPEEAWDFIKFTQRPENLEWLNLGQRKFSPLKEVSEEFYAQHPNPHIRMFRELAESPGAVAIEKIPSLGSVNSEMQAAFDEAWLRRQAPREALSYAQTRAGRQLERALTQWERIRSARLKEWSGR